MKHALILLFAVFAGLSLHAQTFKAGATAGFVTTQIDGDGYAGWNKVGVNGGLFVNTELSDKVTAEFQITYVQKGSVRPIDPDNGFFDYYRIRTDYVEVPLLFRFKGRKFFYDVGPSLGALVRDSEEDLNGITPLPFHDWKRTELALHVGLGYKITDQFHTHVRYSQSVVPVSNDAYVTRWGLIGGSYHQMIVFALRYQFIN